MLAIITWKHLVIAGLVYLIGFMHGVWAQEKEEKRNKKD